MTGRLVETNRKGQSFELTLLLGPIDSGFQETPHLNQVIGLHPPRPRVRWAEMTRERRFGLDYREELTLRDGSPVRFRLVRPDDKALFVDGLSRMSAESRFRRFFSHRDRLSQDELVYLTEIDQERHFALAAGRPMPDGSEVGLGVARFVVFDAGIPDGRRYADAAIAVVDEAQGKGIGRMLFERLVAAAAERGVDVFRVDVLPQNEAMLGLIKRIFPAATSHLEGGVVQIDCPLPDLSEHVAGERPEGALYHMLKLAAEGAIKILRDTRSSLLKDITGAGDREEHDLAELIGLTDDDGPGPT